LLLYSQRKKKEKAEDGLTHRIGRDGADAGDEASLKYTFTPLGAVTLHC
jgi:hypothetical protein